MPIYHSIFFTNLPLRHSGGSQNVGVTWANVPISSLSSPSTSIREPNVFIEIYVSDYRYTYQLVFFYRHNQENDLKRQDNIDSID